jgi:hypothetical protein
VDATGGSEDLDRVDPGGGDGARVVPVVAEVEGVDELLAEIQRREPDSGAGLGVLWHVVPFGASQQPALGAFEQVQVGAVPAGERVVDGGREVGEGVGAGRGEHAPGTRPHRSATATFDQVDSDRDPCSRHGPMLPRGAVASSLQEWVPRGHCRAVALFPEMPGRSAPPHTVGVRLRGPTSRGGDLMVQRRVFASTCLD